MSPTTLLSALAIMIAAGSLTAQPRQHRSDRQDDRAAKHELRGEMRSWFERTVYPDLSAWHKEYDASLSAGDLATLQALRVRAKAIKQMPRDQREQRHDAMEALMKELKPIMKASRAKLRDIFDRNEDKIDGWREQARAMAKQWQDDHQEMEHKRGHGMKHMPFGMGGKHEAVRFVLWDGELPPAKNSSGTATLPDGPATIEIFDMNGALVRSAPAAIVDGRLDRTIDLKGLSHGSYMASIRSSTGVRTTQLVVGP